MRTFVNLLMALTCVLLFSPCHISAKEVINEVNITFPLPKVGSSTRDIIKITSVTTNLNGGQEMLKNGVIDQPGSIVLYVRSCNGRLTDATIYPNVEAGMEYILRGSIRNFTSTLFNSVLRNNEYQSDNKLIKLTVNGKPAKIIKDSSTRSLLFEITYVAPGNLSPVFSTTTASQPDGEINGFGYVDLGLPSGAK